MGELSLEARGERHTNIAVCLFLIEVLGSAALGMVLAALGYSAELALVVVWLVNLVAAWHVAQAARAQGRRAWLWGALAAIWPAVAMGVCCFLTFSRWFGWSAPRH